MSIRRFFSTATGKLNRLKKLEEKYHRLIIKDENHVFQIEENREIRLNNSLKKYNFYKEKQNQPNKYSKTHLQVIYHKTELYHSMYINHTTYGEKTIQKLKMRLEKYDKNIDKLEPEIVKLSK